MDTYFLKSQKDIIDYDVYNMNTKEKAMGFSIGFVLGYFVFSIFFDVFILSIIAGFASGYIGIIVYRNILCNNRKNALLLQFRDMLEALNTSVGTGKNIPDAFLDCLTDMRNQFDEESYIVSELTRILSGYNNNVPMEIMVADFAKRSHCEDIESFSDVFTVALRKGGNMKSVISETKDVIAGKIAMQMEISSLIAGKKNELNIMIIMPFIVVLLVNGMMTTSSDPKTVIVTFIVKVIALCMFIFAYWLGRKFMKIEI